MGWVCGRQEKGEYQGETGSGSREYGLATKRGDKGSSRGPGLYFAGAAWKYRGGLTRARARSGQSGLRRVGRCGHTARQALHMGSGSDNSDNDGTDVVDVDGNKRSCDR